MLLRPPLKLLLLGSCLLAGSGCCASWSACFPPHRRCCPPPPVVANAPPRGCCNGPTSRHYYPPYTYQPAYPSQQPSVSLFPPGPGSQPLPVAPGGIKPVVTEFPPQNGNGVKMLTPIMPPAPEDQKKTPDFSADVPGYQPFTKNISVGLMPSGEGFNWLKSKGFRSVLYLRPPGEEDATLKNEVEAKGLKYYSLEVSPNRLDKDLVKRFSDLIEDAGNQPIFVFDRKGMPTGTMIYLYLRITNKEPDDKARTFATRLGLKEETVNGYEDWWLSIQSLLKKE